MINTWLLLAVFLILAVFIFVWLGRKKTEVEPAARHLKYDFDEMILFVRKALEDMLSTSLYDGGVSAEEYSRRKARRRELQKALRSCMHGDLPAKRYVKLYIRDLLVQTYGLNESNVDKAMPFSHPTRLSPQDCFDILLHSYQKKHGADAFNHLVSYYGLDQLTELEDGTKGYRITAAQIRDIYVSELPRLNLQDKIEIIVQRVYQTYKGLGVIDELRDQNIDGINGGTSGMPPDIVHAMDPRNLANQARTMPQAHNAVWIFYRGKSVQLEFLGFGSDHELKRVCQNIYGFGNPGQLNESRGYIINDMADGSRVVVVRPKMAESWAFFVRKFNDSLVELDQQITDGNARLAIDMLIYLILGHQITAITGRQGSGKTTLLKALIRYIDAKNIRIQESAFEIWARKLYPNKNILSFRETPTVSGQDGLDVQKKTDGAVNIVGEAATHEVVSYVIQAAQVASEYTLFTHHGKTLPSLINALRNSLVASGAFSNEKMAESQVVEVLGFNVNLVLRSGKRYIERITEIIPINSQYEYARSYKEHENLPDKLDAFMDTMTDYFGRVTDKRSYEYRDILVWEDGEYIAKHPISPQKFEEMMKHMDEEDAERFRLFIQEHWSDAA
ncbi:ATPase, T2SS/T4P/T4SS family [Paenibacillus herberti]|uniref:Pilus assembly protein CpaF n=1 Tax=Paenibacillus herberti TaxID=1619309 RepID=A0A229P0T4_9BACL|nr:ATPase, T2SS/T4P/T4SS family [Paenibacillus herberti]OXM15545.1 pilus assembly protein CpaF [Paenibacillus herberti]